MNGWRVMLGGTAAALGALAFLTVVAQEIERLEAQLEHRESAERRARQRQREPAATPGLRPEENAA